MQSKLIWNSTLCLSLSFLLCHSDRDQQSFMLALPASHVVISSFRPCKSIISTEGALRRPVTYDNHPFIQFHPPNPHLALKTTSHELKWTKMHSDFVRCSDHHRVGNALTCSNLWFNKCLYIFSNLCYSREPWIRISWIGIFFESFRAVGPQHFPMSFRLCSELQCCDDCFIAPHRALVLSLWLNCI